MSLQGLVFRIQEHSACFGSASSGQVRTTENFPTKSCILGMLSCALGYTDSRDISRLHEDYSLHVRQDKAGVVLQDEENALGAFVSNTKGEIERKTEGSGTETFLVANPEGLLEKKKRKLKVKDGIYRKFRDYLYDFQFTIVLIPKVVSPTVSLVELENAFNHPKFIPYLGVSKCEISQSRCLGVVSGENVFDIFSKVYTPFEPSCYWIESKFEVPLENSISLELYVNDDRSYHPYNRIYKQRKVFEYYFSTEDSAVIWEYEIECDPSLSEDGSYHKVIYSLFVSSKHQGIDLQDKRWLYVVKDKIYLRSRFRVDRVSDGVTILKETCRRFVFDTGKVYPFTFRGHCVSRVGSKETPLKQVPQQIVWLKNKFLRNGFEIVEANVLNFDYCVKFAGGSKIFNPIDFEGELKILDPIKAKEFFLQGDRGKSYGMGMLCIQ